MSWTDSVMLWLWRTRSRRPSARAARRFALRRLRQTDVGTLVSSRFLANPPRRAKPPRRPSTLSRACRQNCSSTSSPSPTTRPSPSRARSSRTPSETSTEKSLHRSPVPRRPRHLPRCRLQQREGVLRRPEPRQAARANVLNPRLPHRPSNHRRPSPQRRRRLPHRLELLPARYDAALFDGRLPGITLVLRPLPTPPRLPPTRRASTRLDRRRVHPVVTRRRDPRNLATQLRDRPAHSPRRPFPPNRHLPRSPIPRGGLPPPRRDPAGLRPLASPPPSTRRPLVPASPNSTTRASSSGTRATNLKHLTLPDGAFTNNFFTILRDPLPRTSLSIISGCDPIGTSAAPIFTLLKPGPGSLSSLRTLNLDFFAERGTTIDDHGGEPLVGPMGEFEVYPYWHLATWTDSFSFEDAKRVVKAADARVELKGGILEAIEVEETFF